LNNPYVTDIYLGGLLARPCATRAGKGGVTDPLSNFLACREYGFSESDGIFPDRKMSCLLSYSFCPGHLALDAQGCIH
jgi:hypothetical protein